MNLPMCTEYTLDHIDYETFDQPGRAEEASIGNTKGL